MITIWYCCYRIIYLTCVICIISLAITWGDVVIKGFVLLQIYRDIIQSLDSSLPSFVLSSDKLPREYLQVCELWLFTVAWFSILINLLFRASASPSTTPPSSTAAATSSGSTAGTTSSNAAATSSGSTAGPGEYLQVCEFCDCLLLLDSPFS